MIEQRWIGCHRMVLKKMAREDQWINMGMILCKIHTVEIVVAGLGSHLKVLLICCV